MGVENSPGHKLTTSPLSAIGSAPAAAAADLDVASDSSAVYSTVLLSSLLGSVTLACISL